MTSELKQKVAQNIREAFAGMGHSINIFPGDFRTANGFWRRVDVYRWQIYGDFYNKDAGRYQRIEISSWDTLSACARKGMTVTPPGSLFSSWEANAVEHEKATA